MVLDFGRLFVPLDGCNMKRISQINFYRLGHLTRLRDLKPGERYGQFSHTLVSAEIVLEQFMGLNKEILPQAVEKAKQLKDTIQRRLAHAIELISDAETTSVGWALTNFETTLEDELERLPTFLVEPVGAYSFGQLISNADAVFSEGLRTSGIIPNQALKDVQCAGKCLAFDQATACGFHAFRAADAMIRAYYAHFIGSPPPGGKEPRDWGGYIQELRKAIANNPKPRIPNDRTVELLDSIRAMDRNPVIHPEQDLDADTALATFDLCKNVITLMAIDIRNLP